MQAPFISQAYERRAKQVKEKEQEYWKHITPDMMSDEEKKGGVFIRHQPSYRSKALSSFLMKLDRRAAEKSTHQPRSTREVGSPVNRLPPPKCKTWMVKRDHVDAECGGSGDEHNLDTDSE